MGVDGEARPQPHTVACAADGVVDLAERNFSPLKGASSIQKIDRPFFSLPIIQDEGEEDETIVKTEQSQQTTTIDGMEESMSCLSSSQSDRRITNNITENLIPKVQLILVIHQYRSNVLIHVYSWMTLYRRSK